MANQGSWLGALLLGATALGGCAHAPPQAREEPKVSAYQIGREDVLDVAVWRDPDLSRTVPVRPDGKISLPLLGDVEAVGKTPHELAQALTEALHPFVQEPRVSVIVREVNSTRVYVTGEVAQPGAYALRGQMSLVQLIALAGGFSDFADREAIRIISQGDGEVLQVRFSDMISDDAKSRSLRLRPGDTIVVP